MGWVMLPQLETFTKNLMSCSQFLCLSLILLISPMNVLGSSDFLAFHMQQYDLHGSLLGSRTNLVNAEARTFNFDTSLARKCVLIKLANLTPKSFQHIIDEGAVALVIIIPTSFSQLSIKEIEAIREVEAAMVTMETQMAAYITFETKQVIEIYNSVNLLSNSNRASSAVNALFNSLSSDGYQIVVSGSASKPIKDAAMVNVHGRLVGHGNEDDLPTIAIVAHYDSFGVAPDLSFGADGNGSGVIALLEIARVLSKLYTSQRNRPKMNFVFLLSAGGYANYQGAKRFLEDQLDSADSPILSELQFALCLDSIANGNDLHLHVSKKPMAASPGHRFFESLESIGATNNISVGMVHKKINLQNDYQSWEHEKFSLRRLPAFTLSGVQNLKTPKRGSITDTFETLNQEKLAGHISIVLQALLHHIYNDSFHNLPQNTLTVSEDSIESWISMLSSQPRSSQLLLKKDNPFVSNLHQILSRYIGEIDISEFKADRRDPDWAFFDSTTAQMSAYSIKPATFDFFLSLAIASYLAIIHQFVQVFPVVICYFGTKISS